MELTTPTCHIIQFMELRRIPEDWVAQYKAGESLVIIGMHNHPSKSGFMHLIHTGIFKRTWDTRLWRQAEGLEIDLFFMGVKRLPKIIYF